MDNFDFINTILNGRVVLGNKEEINDHLSIIPIYKVKISFLNLKTDVKATSGDGGSGSVNVTPICLIKIENNTVGIINLEGEYKNEGILDSIPNMLSNIDISTLLKNFKMS